MKINATIPEESKYFLYQDVPFRFAGRHFSIILASCGDANPPSLMERVCHLSLGLLLCIPVLGLIAAIFERVMEEEGEVVNAPLTDCDRIISARKEFENTQKLQPYVIVNRTEIVPSTDNHHMFERKNPFVEAWQSQNIEAVMTFLEDPYFDGVNQSYEICTQTADTISTTTAPHLFGVIATKNKELFNIFLSSEKIDIEKGDSSSQHASALNFACTLGSGWEWHVQRLIEKRADPTKQSELGESAFSLAQHSKMNWQCLCQLKIYTSLHEKGLFGRTKLHQAIITDNLQIFNDELSKNICLNVCDNHAFTPLHCAVVNSRIEMVRALLQNGANPNAVTHTTRETPLLILLGEKKKDWIPMALLLLQHGARLDLPNRYGVIPMDLLSNEPLVQKYLSETEILQCREYQNRVNLSTLFGTSFYMRYNEQDTHPNGGNFPAPVFELLNNVAAVPEDMRQSVALAFTFVAADDLLSAWESAQQVLREQKIPLIIPSGWDGHATAVVMYKQWMILANRGAGFASGLHLLFCQALCTEELFRQILKNACTGNLSQNNYHKTIRNAMQAQYLQRIDLKDQKNQNCTWASSASLGLRAAIALMQYAKDPTQPMTLTEDMNMQMKRINHSAKLLAVKTYIDHFKTNQRQMRCEPGKEVLTATALKLGEKIKNEKDPYGLYKQALDLILFSGFPLSHYRPVKSPPLSQCASLYGMEEQEFEELVAPNPKMGDWEV